jgi:hypothetical protein
MLPSDGYLMLVSLEVVALRATTSFQAFLKLSSGWKLGNAWKTGALPSSKCLSRRYLYVV